MNIHDKLTTLDWIVVSLYTIILIFFGFILNYLKNRKGRADEHIFLAGQRLSWFNIGLNMWGTNVGPSMIVSSVSIAYTTGIVAGNFSWYAFLFIFLLAMVFAPRYFGAKITTLPEFLGKRFNQKSRQIFAYFSIVSTLFSWLGITLFTGGILVSQALGCPLWVSLVFLVAISAFFAILGGLETIAYTNAFQMIFLIIISVILVSIGIYKVGGLEQLFAKTPAGYWELIKPSTDSQFPWHAILLGYPVMAIWFWCTDQSMVQSVLGAKNLRVGQKGANFTAWIKLLDIPLFILPGILCYILYPSLKNPDEAYMTMVTGILPAGLVGLILAVILAALISTIDSALNSLSTIFTMDIYMKNCKKSVPNAKIVKIGRFAAAVGAVLAVLIALAFNSINSMDLFSKMQAIIGFLAPPVSSVFLVGILWKKATSKAANATLILGSIFSLVTGILYLWVFPSNVYHLWPHFLLLSFYLFVFLVLFMIAVSVFTQNIQSKSQGTPIAVYKYSSGEKKDKSVWYLWMALAIVMILLYLIFD